MIIERFNIFAVRDGIEAPPEEAAGPANGATTVEDSVARSSPHQSSSPQKRPADNEEVADEPIKSPPPKKRKADNDVDADALLAARLQAEENARARPTRGASTRRAAPIKKKKSKSKTTKRVKAEDDSDLESEPEETTKREVNRSGGFHVSSLTPRRPRRHFRELTSALETIESLACALRPTGRSFCMSLRAWMLGWH